MRRIPILAVLATLALLAVTATSAIAGTRNSGFDDNQIIEYEATVVTTDSPQAEQQVAEGNVVFHTVDTSGNTPAAQCARLNASLPQDATACNVLNFIPTEVGCWGGAWNLQIFHCSAGQTPVELSSDTDIEAAVAAGKGTLEITPILVRCPVVTSPRSARHPPSIRGHAARRKFAACTAELRPLA